MMRCEGCYKKTPTDYHLPVLSGPPGEKPELRFVNLCVDCAARLGDPLALKHLREETAAYYVLRQTRRGNWIILRHFQDPEHDMIWMEAPVTKPMTDHAEAQRLTQRLNVEVGCVRPDGVGRY
jgi:hypothetical protein